MADPATNSLGSDPIPGGSPGGVSARYEPEFEQLQAEISKMENPAGGEIRWKDVVELSRTLLGAKSKDLLVGAYHAYGLLQQQGYQGLLEGLAVLYSMSTAHWEGLFPELKRLRARESALDWLIDRVQRQLETSPPPGADEKAVLEQAVATMDALGAWVNEWLETPNPKFAAMSRALAAKAEQAGGGPAGGETQAAASQSGPTETVAGGASMTAGATGPITNRKAAFERLREVADFLRRTEPHSPVSYLVNRAVKWGNMPLENVLGELVKNNDVRRQILETLGMHEEQSS